MKKKFDDNYVEGHTFEIVNEGKESFKCIRCKGKGKKYVDLRRDDDMSFRVGRFCARRMLNDSESESAGNNFLEYFLQNDSVSENEGEYFQDLQRDRVSKKRSLIYPENDWISVELRYRHILELMGLMIDMIKKGSLSPSVIMEYFGGYFLFSDLDFKEWEEDKSDFAFIEFMIFLGTSDLLSTSDLRVLFEDFLKILGVVELDYEEWKLERKCFF